MSEYDFASNFAFLKDNFSKLHSHGSKAEELYINGFYEECLTRLGKFGETAAKLLIDEVGFDLKGCSQCEKINVLFEEKIIDLKQADNLHALRLKRNNWLHGDVGLTSDQTLGIIMKAFELGKWLAHSKGIPVEKLRFSPLPLVSVSAGIVSAPSFPALLKQAERDEAYNKIVIYAIILQKPHVVKKYIDRNLDKSVQELGEIYMTLRMKKKVPNHKGLRFKDITKSMAINLNKNEAHALSKAFMEAYRDVLFSLSGSIKQIAGDIE